MSTEKTQSAIKEARDQLFVDTADGRRLTTVSDNLGFSRPVFGFSGDDEWRALTRKLALGPRQIEKAFRKILEICVGPEFSRCGVISEQVLVGDSTITLEDASELVQVGTLVLSPGQAGEETIDFCFVDYATNKVFLENPTTNAHVVQVAGNTVLNSPAAVGATSLVLADSSVLPTTYPYTISLGKGTVVEEAVTVSNNVTATNTLTVSATVNAHAGFKADYVRRELLDATFEGRTFLVFDLLDTEELPETGWIRLDANSATVTSGAETYALADGQTLTVDVDGTGGQTATFNTADFTAIGAATAAEVALVITEDIVGASAVDVGGAVVITAHSTGTSTTVQVTGGTANGALGFPTTLVTGVDEVVFYDENSVSDNILYLKTPLANDHSALASVELLQPGADVRNASVIQSGVHWSIFDTTHDQVKVLVPDTLENLAIQDASWIHDTVPTVLGSTTLAAATTATDTVIELASAANFPDEAGMLTIDGTERFFYTLRDEAATPNPTLTLTQPAGAIYAIGTTVDLFEVPYATTDLEEGNPRDAGGAVLEDRYPGPYIFDPAERSLGTVSSTITSLHPPATEMMSDLLIGRETIECKDLSLWNGIATPFQARVGVGTGFEESLTVTDITTAAATVGSVWDSGGASATSTIVVETVGATEAFPEIVGTSTAQYQIIIDEGGGNEEIVTVVDESLTGSLHTLTISGTFSITHGAAETVELVHDVLTVDPTTRQHFGPYLTPTTLGHPVEYLTDTISLTSAVGFSTTGGYIYLNFGDNRLSTRSRLNTIVSPTIYQLDSTADFPTTDFPYQVVLSQGTNVEELINVSANDTGLNRLTFATTPVNIHATGPAPFGGYVAFVTGGMELIEYQDIDTNDVILNPAQVIEKHTVGEVALTAIDFAIPRTDGFSYPFYLPPDRLRCVKDMFEVVRAAGIQVTIIPF